MPKKQPWIHSLKPPARPRVTPSFEPHLNFPNLIQTHHFAFNTLEEATKLAAYITSLYPEKFHKRIELGLNELFFNAIEHGNLGIDCELKAILKKTNQWENEVQKRLNTAANHSKFVEASIEINPSYILLKVKDQGNGFDWRLFNEESEKPSYEASGRGLMMAKKYCFDKVEFSEKGNEVHCLVYL